MVFDYSKHHRTNSYYISGISWWITLTLTSLIFPFIKGVSEFASCCQRFVLSESIVASYSSTASSTAGIHPWEPHLILRLLRKSRREQMPSYLLRMQYCFVFPEPTKGSYSPTGAECFCPGTSQGRTHTVLEKPEKVHLYLLQGTDCSRSDCQTHSY